MAWGTFVVVSSNSLDLSNDLNAATASLKTTNASFRESREALVQTFICAVVSTLVLGTFAAVFEWLNGKSTTDQTNDGRNIVAQLLVYALSGASNVAPLPANQKKTAEARTNR